MPNKLYFIHQTSLFENMALCMKVLSNQYKGVAKNKNSRKQSEQQQFNLLYVFDKETAGLGIHVFSNYCFVCFLLFDFESIFLILLKSGFSADLISHYVLFDVHAENLYIGGEQDVFIINTALYIYNSSAGCRFLFSTKLI
jgi:hypothetical protein